MLIILFGKASIIWGGTFHKKPARTIRSGDWACKSFSRSSELLSCSRLKTRVETPSCFARSKTAAEGLLE